MRLGTYKPPRPAQWLPCLECGRLFLRVPIWRVTCPGRCTARSHATTDRLRREWQCMKPKILPYLIERDRGRCGICRRLVRAAAGPNRPVGDHIIPLSQGGTNELSNLQLAHYTCNARKGYWGGGQLLLFGLSPLPAPRTDDPDT